MKPPRLYDFDTRYPAEISCDKLGNRLPFVRTIPNSPIYEYRPWLGYTGQRNLDSGIGLMDYRARFYSSSMGRFIQPDTITPDMTQGLNRYSYVGNNPVNFNDPNGHNPILAVALLIGGATIAGSIGGAAGYGLGVWLTGGKFDKTSFWVATIGGGVTAGVATGMGLATGPGGFLATMAVGNVVQYAVDRELHNDPVNYFDLEEQIDLGAQFLIELAGGLIGGPTSSSFVGGGLRRMSLEFGKQTMYQTTKQAA